MIIVLFVNAPAIVSGTRCDVESTLRRLLLLPPATATTATIATIILLLAEAVVAEDAKAMFVVVVVVEVVAVVVARVAGVAVAEATAARHRSRSTTSAKDVATTIYLHCRCNRRLLPLAIGFATVPVLDAWDGITPGRDARDDTTTACIVPRLAHVRVVFRGPPSSGRFCCERGGLWWIYAPACPRPRCRPPSSPRPSSRRRGAERAGRPSRRGAHHHRFGRDRLPSRGPRLEAAVPARIVYCIRCGPRWHAIRGLRTSKK